jgi:regulator of protease activity HflC (stomatin/prohibitin superfamily)
MLYIVFCIFFIIATAGCYFFTKTFFPAKLKDVTMGLSIGLPILLIVLTLLSSITIISTGYIGVIRTFGEVDQSPALNSGLHFIAPWQSVYTGDNRTESTELSKPAEAASRDLQSVFTNITVNWHVDPTKFGNVLQKFGMGNDGGSGYIVDKVVVPSILETFKSVLSQYTAEELVTRRAEVSAQIADHLTNKLARYDLVVEANNITDFQFSKEFNGAIEAKVKATQEALQAEQVLTKVKIEAQQNIAKAEGNARAIQIQAEAIKAQGGAAYVQLQAINKWNGVLPTTMLSEKSVPFISVSKKED